MIQSQADAIHRLKYQMTNNAYVTQEPQQNRKIDI